METNQKILPSGSTRRDFITQMMLLSCATMLPPFALSCVSDDGKMYEASGIPPFKVWEEMIMALETSPDHLEGRMKQLIAEKNPEAMFHFVRDAFYIIPPSDNSFYDLGSKMKWGLKGALRYGMATPREKAELLSYMFNEAGITASVMSEQVVMPEELVKKNLYRPIERKFEPQISNKQLKKWKKELQLDAVPEFKTNVDKDYKEAIALAEKIWENIPNKEKLQVPDFDFRWSPHDTPTVKFELNGETKYAHLFDVSVPFGQLKDSKSELRSASKLRETSQTLKITVNYLDSYSSEEKELIAGEWLLTDLMANQISLQFLDGLSLDEKAVTPIGSLRTFTPALAFQSIYEEIPFLEERSVIANPITIEGKRIDLTGDSVKVGATPISVNPNLDLQKTVTRMDIEAKQAMDRLIKLDITATDAEGKFVEGLAATDFKIMDNGVLTSALMETNRQSPKILIVYDTSTSMPSSYYGSGMIDFLNNLHNSILDVYPATEIESWKMDSNLFSWLLKASKTSFDLILFATDGETTDKYNPENELSYKAAPPMIMLNVKNLKDKWVMETFEQMAKSTNGSIIDAADQELTISLIKEHFQSLKIAPYVFTFHTGDNVEERTVSVSLDNDRLMAQTKYQQELRPKDNNNIAQNIIGLYLKVQVGNGTVIDRVLAGWDPNKDAAQTPDYSHVLDVWNTFLGGISFTFEGEGPTTSTAICDILKYRLSNKEWMEHIQNNDVEKAKAVLDKKGILHYNALAFPMMAPLENPVSKEQDAFTFADGTRIGIIKQKPGVDQQMAQVSFDYLPTSNYRTIANNKETSFKATLEKTAQLAIREKLMFSDNTFQQLKDAKLIERSTAHQERWALQKVGKENIYFKYWNHVVSDRSLTDYRLMDTNHSSLAFWEIDKKTGELYGVLPNGTGGGTNSYLSQLISIQNVISFYKEFASYAGYKTLSAGIVIIYLMTLVKLYGIASVKIAAMNTAGMDDEIKDAIAEMACNLGKEILFTFIPPQLGRIDTFLGIVGGGGLIKC